MTRNKKKLPPKIFRILSLILVFLLTAAPLSAAAAQTNGAPDETPDATLERKIIGYFCEWRDTEIGQNYTVDKLPWGQLTHINYAFAALGSDNKIQLMDTEAAIEREYPEQDPTLPYKGHFNLLTVYKERYPGTQTLISVGGWAASGNFFPMTDTEAGIRTFAESCVDFIRQYGFNGVDIDFEYPSSTPLSGNPLDSALAEPRRAVIYEHYVELMRILREELDQAGEEDGTHYLLSIAAPASSWILGGMQLGEYAQYLDYVNMMTYDFHGSWNGHVGPQSALYPDSRDTETASMVMPVLNIDWAYRYFRGVLPPEKINVGAPFYTRGWKNVSKGRLPGGLWGTAATTGGGADGIDGIWNDPLPEQPGGANPLYHVKNLLADPSLGYEYFWDDVSKTPYVWNEGKKVFLTFEDEDSITEKCNYIVDNGLGGLFVWEFSGDFDYDAAAGEYVVGDTLITTARNVFDNAPPLTPYQEYQPSEDEKANFEFSFTGSYSHPNYTYAFTVVNKTGADIPGGYTLAFDFPKSAILQTPWGAAIDSATDNGDFTHYVLTMPAWSSLPNNGSYTMQGMIKLCFTGGFQNVQLNGKYSRQEFPEVVDAVSKPVINGVQNTTLTVGDPFDAMAGISADDETDGDLTGLITVTGTVNTAVAGTYQLTYSVTNTQNQTTTVQRTVTVVAPVIAKPTISGAINREITVGDSFDAMAGVTAADAADGDLTAAISVSGTVDSTVAGVYELTYSVTNSQNETTTVTRTITVSPKPVVKPVISGVADREISVGDSFDAMAGITASDAIDGDLTAAIVADGNVDTNTPGVYTVSYSVTNSGGETTVAEATVTVKDPVVPAYPEWSAAAVYVAGDMITYQGKVYRAKWWTQNNIPGTEQWGPWELID